MVYMYTCVNSTFSLSHMIDLYFQTDHYGGSNQDKVVANIQCTGKEDRLEDCTIEKTQNTPGHEVCSSAKSVAGVICDTRKLSAC